MNSSFWRTKLTIWHNLIKRSSYQRHSTTLITSKASSKEYEFTYIGDDGRKKATFEQAFKNKQINDDTVGSGATHILAPWELGYQMSEKNLAWNDDLKSRLLARVASERLGLTDEQLEHRLQLLNSLLPEIRNKLGMPANTLVQLLSDIDHLPERLMNLKATFPGANISKLAIRAPDLVLGFDTEHLQKIATILRELLPNVDVDKLVEENPSVLDVEEFQAAMQEAKRIMPKLDLQMAMQVDPQLILSFQRGSQLIPYDPPVPVDEEEGSKNGAAAADDEYAAYYK